MKNVPESMLRDLLPDTAAITKGGLEIGGCNLEDLAAEFGTPLYVYDERTLRSGARQARDAFVSIGARVSFAAKACGTLAVLRVFQSEGLGLDVVSEGEMEAGSRAGFDASRQHLHGNSKSDVELRRAVRSGVHAVVADNAEELERLQAIACTIKSCANVHLRVRLPLEAETHPHLRTAGYRSKFGFALDDLAQVRSRLTHHSHIEVTGVHVHLGSQLRDAAIYGSAARQLIEIAGTLRASGLPVCEVSVGGGWAVAYAPGDTELSPSSVAREIQREFSAERWIRPAVEPGRALVARSAVALYRVRSVKNAAPDRIIAVDGGMGDNPRPALYEARYYAFLPSRIDSPSEGRCDVVGRYCESGDILATSVPMAAVVAGDLVCTPVAGAYQLSMSSNYNLVPRPAAVMVNEGNARRIVRRETVEDLFAREMHA